MLAVGLGGQLGGVDDDIPPRGRPLDEALKLGLVAVGVGHLVEQAQVASALLGGGLDLDEEAIVERPIERDCKVGSASHVSQHVSHGDIGARAVIGPDDAQGRVADDGAEDL